MEDLVGVGVADAAEKPGVGERALQGVVLGAKPLREGVAARGQRLQSSALELLQGCPVPKHVQRGPPPGPGFRQDQPSGREGEYGEGDSPGRLLAGKQPTQAPGDHQVDHHEAILRELQDNPLAQPGNPTNIAALQLGRRHLNGTQHEGAQHLRPFQPPPADVPFEGLDIDRDVGEFGHDRGSGIRD